MNFYDIPRKELSGEVSWRVGIRQKNPEKTNKWSKWESFFFYGSSLDMIKKRGEVRVGVDSGYEGRFIRFDKEDKKLKGYDIEIAETIVKNLEIDTETNKPLRPVFYGYDWSRLLGAPRRHEVDMIIGMISKNKSREDEYGLLSSVSYLDTCQSFACLSDPKKCPEKCKEVHSKINTIEHLKGKTLVIQEGTTARKIAKKLAGEKESVYAVSSTSATFVELIGGYADAVIADYNINLDKRDEMVSEDMKIDVTKIDVTKTLNMKGTENLYAVDIGFARLKKSNIEKVENLKGKNLVVVNDERLAKLVAKQVAGKYSLVNDDADNYNTAFDELLSGNAVAIIGDYKSIIEEKEKVY